MHDRAGAHVSSALGVSTPAVEVHPDLNFLSLAKNHQAAHGALDYLVGDEAQFYTDPQVEQLAQVVDELDVDVYAFGLLTDFRGKLFPGSARLLEIADERMELQVQARCWCGEAATHNARLHDGNIIGIGTSNAAFLIDEFDDAAKAKAHLERLGKGGTQDGDDAWPLDPPWKTQTLAE